MTFGRELFAWRREVRRALFQLRVCAWRPLRGSCRWAAPRQSPRRASRWDREWECSMQLPWMRRKSATASGLTESDASGARIQRGIREDTAMEQVTRLKVYRVTKLLKVRNPEEKGLSNCYSMWQVGWEAETKTTSEYELGAYKTVTPFPVLVADCQMGFIWPQNTTMHRKYMIEKVIAQNLIFKININRWAQFSISRNRTRCSESLQEIFIAARAKCYKI